MTKTAAGTPFSWGAWLRRVMIAPQIWSLADQAAVSLASFITLVLIARWNTAEEVGIYAVGASAVAILIATLDALITRPYAIQLFKPLGTPAEHAGSALAFSAAMAAVAGIGLALAGAASMFLGASPAFTLIAWVLAAAAPFMLMREFARRFLFAQLDMIRAAFLDGGVAAISLLFMLWLGWTGRLSAASAFVALGAACALVVLLWLVWARQRFARRSGQYAAAMRRSWGLGKWFFLGQLALQAQGYSTHWLSLAIAGASVTGVYAACLSIIAFSNPLLFSFVNALTPKFVRALRHDGTKGLKRETMQATLLLGGAMAVFCAAVYLAGPTLMRLLYPGGEYSGYGHTLNALALSVLAAAVGVPASLAMASAERGRMVAVVTAATALLNVALVWFLLPRGGLLGAAYGILLAEICGSLMRWTAFLTLPPLPADGKPEASEGLPCP